MPVALPQDPLTVLMVDDDAELSAMVAELLHAHGMRVHCAGTAAQGLADLTQLRFDGLTLDLLARRVKCQGEPLSLTSTEFKLLLALASQPGVCVSRQALSAAVQPGNYVPMDRAVDVQVARLRKKLSAAPGGRDWIETVRGEGYVFTGSRL